MTSVSFKNITKTYGRNVALDGLTLDIAPGEFVSLLGPSGSGKSTTLNLLAGLLPADEGQVFIGEKDVTRLTPDKRDIAMVFQNYALYPHMTIYENLAFPLKAKGRRVPKETIRQKISEVAELLGVEALLQRFPKELSGGQQQRVALGRSMIRDPSVFLLDEPLSNLDARLRIRMRRDIKALHERIGSTIVYVTHDQAEAMTLSSRIAVFSEGRLQQYGTPNQIYNDPANMFVANFVGEREITFLKGRLEARGNSPHFVAGNFTVPLPRETFDEANREAVLGVRAEGVEVDQSPDSTGADGRIEQLEMVGPDLVLFVTVGDDELCCRVDPRTEIAKGAAVKVRLRPDAIHLFDPVSTETLRLASRDPAAGNAGDAEIAA